MFGYIYKTTFPDGKVYIGQKQSGFFCQSYFGSGVYVKRYIKKYGTDDLKVEVIDWCGSLEELNQKEIFYIKEFNSIIPNGYNMSIGGTGGNLGHLINKKLKKLNQQNRMHNKHHSEKTKKVMSEKAKKVDRSYLSNYMFITNGLETKKILKNQEIPQGFYRGRTFSEKTLESMKNAGIRKTQKFIEQQKKIELEKYGSLGLSSSEKKSITINKQLDKLTKEEKKQKFGRPMSEENKRKLSERMKGNKYSKSHKK